MSAIIISSGFMALTVESPKNAYATNQCPGQPNNHCYAIHSFNQEFTGAYNGIRNTQQVLYTSVASGSWVESSDWAIHPDGVHFAEVGWHQPSNGATPYFICGAGTGASQGNFQVFGSTPSNGGSYTLSADDLNLDTIWHFSVSSGGTCDLMSTSSSAFKIQTGYELTNSDAQTLRTDDYSGMQFGRAPSTWTNWNSADGGNGWELDPDNGLYFVKFCSDNAFTHSQHGQGTPSTC